MRALNTNTIVYTPGTVPRDQEQMVNFLQDELLKLQNVIAALAAGHVDETHVAPTKPRTGDIRLADGTNWNPGTGQGVYAYYNSTWNKL